MKRTKIALLLKTYELGSEVNVKGWVKSFRNNQFIQINDGSTINNIQAVLELDAFDAELVRRVTTGAAVSVSGKIVESSGAGQKIEMLVSELEVIGDANPEDVAKTVMQPKRHSLEYLREQAHLRFRTNIWRT
jgi:asparaginyl-tRNA synthetase